MKAYYRTWTSEPYKALSRDEIMKRQFSHLSFDERQRLLQLPPERRMTAMRNLIPNEVVKTQEDKMADTFNALDKVQQTELLALRPDIRITALRELIRQQSDQESSD